MNSKKINAQPTTTHLAERIDQLSIKRQEIIRPILEHPREYVLLSVRAMAKRLQTDPATIVRIVRGLGFASYREFQRHLHELSLAFATSLDTMQSGSRDVSMPAHVRDSLEQDLKNVQGLKNSLDARRLSRPVPRISDQSARPADFCRHVRRQNPARRSGRQQERSSHSNQLSPRAPANGGGRAPGPRPRSLLCGHF